MSSDYVSEWVLAYGRRWDFFIKRTNRPAGTARSITIWVSQKETASRAASFYLIMSLDP
jgi:hypothetical protein